MLRTGLDRGKVEEKFMRNLMQKNGVFHVAVASLGLRIVFRGAAGKMPSPAHWNRHEIDSG